MLSALLATTLLFFQSPPNKIEQPPLPDFKTRVDYFEWYKKQIKGSFSDDQNVSMLYAKTYAGPTDFQGPLEDPDTKGVAPWTPAEHPGWEKSFQASKATIDSFRLAAAKGYYLDPKIERRKTMDELLQPQLSHMRQFAKQNLDRGWRAEQGKVNPAELLLAIRTNLDAARQVQRDPMLLSYLVGVATRAMTYESLFSALDRDLLDAKARTELLTAIRTFGPGSFEYNLSGETMLSYDLLQFIKFEKDATLQDESLQKVIANTRSQPIDFAATRDAVRDYYQSLAVIARKPFSGSYKALFEAELKKLQGLNAFTQAALPSLDRAYILGRRAEAMRRATLVVLQLQAYHDQNHKYPAALADLGQEAQYEILDPFTDNKPFVYKLDGDKFTLYSVAQNAADDGGTHDEHWGDKQEKADYVFWPPQERR